MAFNLASISAEPTITPPRIVIYGPHGLGKTSFCSEAPAPILLPTEDGRGKLAMPSFPLAKSLGDVYEAISTLLTEDHPFQTLCLDSVDWLEPMIWAAVCADNNWQSLEQPGFGKGYLAADDKWREFFSSLVALRDEKGMQVILTAHTKVKRFDDPSQDPYDRYMIKLHERASAILQEWADAVLFLNTKTVLKKVDTGFKQEVSRGISTGERVLFTEERPSHLAKNRYGLPAEIKAPKGGSYAAFAGHLFN